MQHNREDTLRYRNAWAAARNIEDADNERLLFRKAAQRVQGHVEKSTLAYAKGVDLNKSSTCLHQRPSNTWAWHGYHACLVHLGRADEASLSKKQPDVAAAGANLTISASCFCCLKMCICETAGGKQRSPTSGYRQSDEFWC